MALVPFLQHATAICGRVCRSVGAALTLSAAVETDENEAALAAGSSVTDGSLPAATYWPLFTCFFLGTIVQVPPSLLSTAAGLLVTTANGGVTLGMPTAMEFCMERVEIPLEEILGKTKLLSAPLELLSLRKLVLTLRPIVSHEKQYKSSAL